MDSKDPAQVALGSVKVLQQVHLLEKCAATYETDV